MDNSINKQKCAKACDQIIDLFEKSELKYVECLVVIETVNHAIQKTMKIKEENGTSPRNSIT